MPSLTKPATIPWPRIADVDKKTLSQVALELALWCVAQGYREDKGRFNRGLYPDMCNASVGLAPEGAYPWCTSAWYPIYVEAARQKRVKNPFPETAKAVSVYDYFARVAPQCLDSNPAPGAHYVLSHGREWAKQLGKGQRLTDNGHFGACVDLDGPNCASEVSANTNRRGAREGDSWWIHSGTPEVSHGGTLLAWIHVDRIAIVSV